MDNLKQAGFHENWLFKQIKQRGSTRFEDILYAEWKTDEGFFCQKINES